MILEKKSEEQERMFGKNRGLMVEDLDGMTQGEKEKYVKKDCVWPKEDMKSLVADGII